MNAAALPSRQLACLLHDTAAGLCAESAAIALIASHDHFLHQPAFRRIIAAGSSFYSGQPVAVIRWRAAIYALEHGYLPCTASQDAVLRIAASLADHDIGVRLRQALDGLEPRDTALVTGAITAASG